MTETFSTTRTVDEAIDLLNSALQADPEAVDALIRYRVPCNEKMGDHETIQCGVRKTTEVIREYPHLGSREVRERDGNSETVTTVGLLGIINGIFGLRRDASQYGHIAAVVDDDDKAQRGA